MTAVPVMLPRLLDDPSFQLMFKLLTALPPAGTVTVNVKDAGSPALGGVVGGVITSVGWGVTVTVKVAVGAAVVVVPLTVAAPAVAVIFAVDVVVSVVCALPPASEVTTAGKTVPTSLVKLTGTPPRALPPVSTTVAVIVVLPPMADTEPGLALSVS